MKFLLAGQLAWLLNSRKFLGAAPAARADEPELDAAPVAPGALALGEVRLLLPSVHLLLPFGPLGRLCRSSGDHQLAARPRECAYLDEVSA